MNFVSLILLLQLVLLLGLAAYVFISLRRRSVDHDADKNLLRGTVNEVLGELINKITEQSKSILASEKEIITTDMHNKHAQIEKVVVELRHELQERQRELHALEQERGKQFSEIATQIREHQSITKELEHNTKKLQELLANNQTRGQWGEFILDDILANAGLIEGVHYRKQAALGSGGVKPDITLILPNDRSVAVDVKFPYAAVQRLAKATNAQEKQVATKEFVRDVKAKVQQIVERGYINPEAGTLDYALLFVPNETLFSFINQAAPEVVEMAMAQRVMIVSPFTFLIVARTIRESYRNFMVEKNLRKIIGYINDFVGEWERFTGEFNKFDDQLHKMRKAFDQIHDTRYQRMQLRLERIGEAQHGILGPGAKSAAIEIESTTES